MVPLVIAALKPFPVRVSRALGNDQVEARLGASSAEQPNKTLEAHSSAQGTISIRLRSN
jgi:hypothetical protein